MRGPELRAWRARESRSSTVELPPDEKQENAMAQRIQTLFIDDIDGGEAAGTVRFALDGAEYEIDLSAEHADELHTALGKYIGHARKAGGTPGQAPRGHRNASIIDTHNVREWAREQGIEIKERGRVPASIVEKYRQATGQ
jgi:Lsr2